MNANLSALNHAAAIARGLAIDAISGCKSGHLGLPLGAAEIGAALYGHALCYNPEEPRWINRDRLVVSAGHGSMFLYAWLHLAGYGLSIEDLKAFRKLGSITPGHPEFGDTPGVEATTGPLGQGVGNAVGMAVSAKMAAARFNTSGHEILNHKIVALAGDGCLQEGVALEATELAGHLGLDNLILVYDSNDVTLDAPAASTQSRNTAGRFEACGWGVEEVDGHDVAALLEAFAAARAENEGRPRLIIARTEIGRGIPEVAGTPKAHGEGGGKFAESARRGLGLPDERFFVSGEVREYFRGHRRELQSRYEAWLKDYRSWSTANPELSRELVGALKREAPTGLSARIPDFPEGANPATRKACGDALQQLAVELPRLVSLSADLFGSNQNYIGEGGEFMVESRCGRNLRAGIREHAMGAVCNGLAYEGLFRPVCGTFMVFSDYLRPAIRLACMAGLPVIYYFTHDSVGVGEDGPTHQPVESVSALRLLPGLELFRPADCEEAAGALVAALERLEGPTVLALSRQALPAMKGPSSTKRREGLARGAYICREEEGELELILLASGSELQLALAAEEILRAEGRRGIRVVSMPGMERFDKQDAAWREEVLPASCRRRLAVEAGVGGLWHRYTGLDGRVLSIERFGLSAPAGEVMQALGISVDAVAQTARELLD